MEFWLAYWTNAQKFVSTVSVLTGFAAVVVFAVRLGLHITARVHNSDNREYPTITKGRPDVAVPPIWHRSIAGLLGAVIVLGLLAALPNARDLWEVRLSLIKYELASPENVKAGAAEIGRIAHKLECKYLGGDGCAEAKP